MQAQGLKEEALAIATDADYKFELAVSLGKLEVRSLLALLVQRCKY